MKLSGREAKGYFSRPDPMRCGTLIYGPDAMRIALKRQDIVAALIGPKGDEEMRLTRINGGELRKDPALLSDAIKAQGFFPGPRVALVEEATDSIAKLIETAMEDWQEGDAVVIVTAGQLTPRSGLRKFFEGHKNAYAAAIYADPPGRDEIESTLGKAGIKDIPGPIMGELLDLGRVLEPGDFNQTIEKLSLYKLGDPEPISSEDIIACAPATSEAALDDALDIVAEGRVQELGPILSQLEAQGIAAVRLCIGATQHFRKLYTAASDPKGVEAGLSRARPPVPYMRKDRMGRQASAWGVQKLESALQVLTDTDLQLRSSQPVPHMALMERALIRLAMMGRR